MRSRGGSPVSSKGDPAQSSLLVRTPPIGKWINYEIGWSWDDGMGVVGIRIHGLKNFKGLSRPLATTRSTTSPTRRARKSSQRS